MEGTVVKRLFAITICVVGLMASAPAQAAPIIVPTTDTVLGTVFVDLVAGTQTFAIEGIAPADVVEGAATVNSGVVDAAAGDPPDTAIFFDLVDDAILFDFDFGSSAFNPDFSGIWTLLAAGSALLGTDPTLAAFLVPNNLATLLPFGEAVITQDETGAPISALFTFSLESIAAPAQVEVIPEPATITLVGMGILAAARARRARRARRKQDQVA